MPIDQTELFKKMLEKDEDKEFYITIVATSGIRNIVWAGVLARICMLFDALGISELFHAELHEKK
ncbi:MAG: hypothetical protein GF334_06475 [Candidatus Altiarchaeales archaeon]|nr:hypothetical protein [Candidatus Altiarchaeales archaeon]